MAKNVIIGQSGGPTAVINSSLAGVYKAACSLGADKVYGMKYGIEGLLKEEMLELNVLLDDRMSIELLKRTPSSYLGSCRFKLPDPDTDATPFVKLFTLFDKYDICAVFYIGGNDSMDTIAKLSRYGQQVGSNVRFIGVPKTIDNDLGATDVTFGFYSAVSIVSESLDRLETTANAHQRMMVVEVMGRHAGWIALEGGIAGSADVILLPEIPFSIENVVKCIKDRKAAGQREILVVVSEGARLADELVLLDEKTQGEVRLGGIGKVISKKLEEATGIETRSCVLGHIQRGGSPCAYDRILGVRFGSYAVELVEKRKFSCMVALRGTQMTAVPIEEAVKTLKLVDPDCQLVRTARDLGVCFGD